MSAPAAYSVEVEDRAARELADLPKAVIARAFAAIAALAGEPRPPGARKLTGREGYRVRVGDYRVLYEIEDEAHRVRVYKVAHRKDVYRR